MTTINRIAILMENGTRIPLKNSEVQAFEMGEIKPRCAKIGSSFCSFDTAEEMTMKLVPSANRTYSINGRPSPETIFDTIDDHEMIIAGVELEYDDGPVEVYFSDELCQRSRVTDYGCLEIEIGYDLCADDDEDDEGFACEPEDEYDF